MPRKYFGTDGIRGEYGVAPLTNNFFVVLGMAIAKSLLSSKSCKKKILFGADTRESCNQIISLISQGLNKESCEISNAGIVPTPAVAYYSKKENFDLGIMVSASHNSYQDNGIKIFNNNGFKISFDDENYIENYIETISNQNNSHDKSKATIQDISKKVEQDYIKFCLQTLKGKIFKKNRITLDLANGANYKIARKVFTEAGFDINVHNDNPNGKNINDKCGSTYITKLPELIKSDESDFGISMDGDGDRLVVVDKNSRVLDGDDILYTIVRGKKINNEKVSGVVGTTMTNCALEHYLKEENINFIRTNVGDKYVLEEMLKIGCYLGGETSGHILMLEHSTSGDSLIAALQFLYYSDILKKNNAGELLKKYPQKITNLLIDRNLPENIINIAIKEASDKYTADSLRLIIRKSGTENCIRIMVEAKDKSIVDKMSLQIKDYIEGKLKKLL